MGSLGQLIVEITTDLTSMNVGLKAAETGVKNASGKIAEYTTKVGIIMTAMGAAITGAFAMMVKSSTDFGEELYRVSEQSGIAVEKLSELKYVAEQTESSFTAVAMSMKFLNRNIYEATEGNIKMNESFRALGIILKDEVTGQVMKADEVFLAIADKFKAMEDASAKTALAMQLFGRQGVSIIPVLNLGSEGIKKLSDEAHRLGIILTSENAKALDKFGDSTKTLKEAFGGLWLNISLLLVPALTKAVGLFTNAVVSLREFSQAHPVLAKNVTALAATFGVLMLAIGPLLIAIPPLIIMFATLNVAAAPIIAGVLLVAAAIGVLTLALVNAKAIWAEFIKFMTPAMKFFGMKTPAAPAPGAAEATAGTTTETGVEGTGIDETISKVEKHAQKVKELNDEYLTGQINAQKYYNEIRKLHEDGLDIKQEELDLLNQSIELERMATDAEYQRIYVMSEGIRTAQEYARVKAEMANQDLVDQQNTLNAATDLLRTLQSMHVTIWQGIFDFVNMGIQKFSSGFSNALTSIIMGTKKASEAFKDFGAMMLQAVVEFLVQWAVQAAISMALGWLLVKMVTAQATAIANAWMPAAIAASIATLGTADAIGAAALAGAMMGGMGMLVAVQKAGQVTAMASTFTTLGEGGIVTEPTLALIGERGPEMVTPLDKAHSFRDINIILDNVRIASDMDIRELAEKLGENVKDEMKRP